MRASAVRQAPWMAILNWVFTAMPTVVVVMTHQVDDQNTMVRPPRRADGAAC